MHTHTMDIIVTMIALMISMTMMIMITMMMTTKPRLLYYEPLLLLLSLLMGEIIIGILAHEFVDGHGTTAQQ